MTPARGGGGGGAVQAAAGLARTAGFRQRGATRGGRGKLAGRARGRRHEGRGAPGARREVAPGEVAGS